MSRKSSNFAVGKFLMLKAYRYMRNILEIARYTGISLLSKGLSVSPLKLQKILYYEQAWFMVFFGRENTLFEDVPEAWVNGPVYPCVYKQYRSMVDGMCDYLTAKDFGTEDVEGELEKLLGSLAFSDDERDLLEQVILMYGSKSQNQLIFLTHSELPWTEKREGLMPYERSNNPISLDTMYKYYRDRHEHNKSKRG